MTATPERISLVHGGREQVLLEGDNAVSEVSRLLHEHADASDVTVSIKLPGDYGTLLVALEAGTAFVGLDRPGGVYQYVANAASDGQREFIIGGQPTAIDSRYVLPIRGAIELLTSCLEGPDPLAEPAWERQ